MPGGGQSTSKGPGVRRSLAFGRTYLKEEVWPGSREGLGHSRGEELGGKQRPEDAEPDRPLQCSWFLCKRAEEDHWRVVDRGMSGPHLHSGKTTEEIRLERGLCRIRKDSWERRTVLSRVSVGKDHFSPDHHKPMLLQNKTKIRLDVQLL